MAQWGAQIVGNRVGKGLQLSIGDLQRLFAGDQLLVGTFQLRCPRRDFLLQSLVELAQQLFRRHEFFCLVTEEFFPGLDSIYHVAEGF